MITLDIAVYILWLLQKQLHYAIIVGMEQQRYFK
jgi:hypothetical protein